jgi:hypothetical protein
MYIDDNAIVNHSNEAISINCADPFKGIASRDFLLQIFS